MSRARPDRCNCVYLVNVDITRPAGVSQRRYCHAVNPVEIPDYPDYKARKQVPLEREERTGFLELPGLKGQKGDPAARGPTTSTSVSSDVKEHYTCSTLN